MAQERVDIVINDLIMPTIIPKLQQMATAAAQVASATAAASAASVVAAKSAATYGAAVTAAAASSSSAATASATAATSGRAHSMAMRSTAASATTAQASLMGLGTATATATTAANAGQASLMGYSSSTAAASAGSRRFSMALRSTGVAAAATTKSMVSLGMILRTMFMLYFAVAAAQRILAIADNYTVMANKLKVVTTTAEGARVQLGRLAKISMETGTSVDATVTLYQRLALAFDNTTVSGDDLEKMVSTVNKAIILGGANTQETAASIRQLSQAFNKGKADGDEFRSMMENAPVIMKLVADEMGKNKQQLLLLAEQGKITGDIMAAALLDGEDVSGLFKEAVITLGRAITNLNTGLIIWNGKVQDITHFNENLAKSIDWVAQNVDILAASITSLMTLVAVIKISSITAGLLRMGAAIKTAAIAIRTALLALTPVGWAVALAVALGSAALVVYNRYIKDTEDAMAKLKQNIVAAGNAIIAMITAVSALGFTSATLGIGKAVWDAQKISMEAAAGAAADLNKDLNDVGDTATKATPYEKMMADLRAVTWAHIEYDGQLSKHIQLMRVKQAMQQDGLVLDDKQIAAAMEQMEMTRRAVLVGELAQQAYENGKGAVSDLSDELTALTKARDEGFISARQYGQAEMQIAADMQRTQLAISDTVTAGTAFNHVWESMRLGVAQLGAEMPLVFQGIADVVTTALKQMSDGVGDLVAQWAVFGESMRFIDVFRQVVAQMIQSLVSLTTQYMLVGIMRTFALGGTMKIPEVDIIGPPAPVATPFYSGGYTGAASKHAVAGVVHGKEFVVNARATAKNRGVLEAMNSGGSVVPNVIINNNSSGATVGAEFVSATEVRLICEDTVNRKAGTAVARDIGNPNSNMSRSLKAHTIAGRRGV